MRTRFIIPTDGSSPDRLPAPHFDTAAANSARPVRPITETDETVVHRRPAPQGVYAPPPVVQYVPPPLVVVKPARKGRALLVAFLILVAAFIGLAGGYGIAHFPVRSKPQTIVAAAAFLPHTELPELVFNLPPEEITEDTELTDLDGEVAEEVVVADENQDLDRTGPDPNPNSPPFPRVKRPVADPDPPTDNSGDIRQRRVPGANDTRSASNRRGRNQTGPPEDPTDTQIRRNRRGVITRIREIFEGRP